MRQQLKTIKHEGDALALATVEEQQQLARVRNMERALARRSPSDDTALLRERVKRLKGLLVWKVSSDFNPRLWNLTRETRDLGRALDQANAGRRTLAREESETPKRFKQLATRISVQRPTIITLRKQTRALMQDQQQYLGSLAIAELRRQQQRLKTYIVQARFGILQTYDQARKVKEKGQ